MSVLEHIGRYLPKLEHLSISVVACETANLAPDRLLRCLKHLQELELETSLLNFRLPGFDYHQAARYISGLITSSASFTMEPLDLDEFRGNWTKFAIDYNDFIRTFVQRVQNYVDIREGESSRNANAMADGDI
jgi:hypothetical protein